MEKKLTAPILCQLTAVCPFPDLFQDTEPSEGCVMFYPRSKIGHIRADHNGYRWWNTVWPCHKELTDEAISKEIDDTYDALVSEDALRDLATLREFCFSHPDARVNPDQEDEYSFYLVGECCYYWVRLITRERDYNMYLSAYSKRKANERYFDYLDALRDSGVTNMLGAGPYLQEAFPELAEFQGRAKEVLSAWIKSFEKREDA